MSPETSTRRQGELTIPECIPTFLTKIPGEGLLHSLYFIVDFHIAAQNRETVKVYFTNDLTRISIDAFRALIGDSTNPLAHIRRVLEPTGRKIYYHFVLLASINSCLLRRWAGGMGMCDILI